MLRSVSNAGLRTGKAASSFLHGTLPGLLPAVEPSASGVLDVGQGHHVYWETVGTVAGRRWCSCTAAPVRQRHLGAAPVRSVDLPGRLVRSARMRTQHPPGGHRGRRPVDQHHRPLDRRHRSSARAPGDQPMGHDGHLVGRDADPDPTPSNTPTASARWCRPRSHPGLDARPTGSPRACAECSRASGTPSPPQAPSLQGRRRWRGHSARPVRRATPGPGLRPSP
jgi:hypothetical protein